jgi:hypothetical protein
MPQTHATIARTGAGKRLIHADRFGAPRPIASRSEIGKTHVGETTVGVCGALISLR